MFHSVDTEGGESNGGDRMVQNKREKNWMLTESHGERVGAIRMKKKSKRKIRERR